MRRFVVLCLLLGLAAAQQISPMFEQYEMFAGQMDQIFEEAFVAAVQLISLGISFNVTMSPLTPSAQDSCPDTGRLFDGV